MFTWHFGIIVLRWLIPHPPARSLCLVCQPHAMPPLHTHPPHPTLLMGPHPLPAHHTRYHSHNVYADVCIYVVSRVFLSLFCVFAMQGGPPPPGHVTVRAYLQHSSLLRRDIFSLLVCQVQMTIGDDCIGRIIGKGGSTVADIRRVRLGGIRCAVLCAGAAVLMYFSCFIVRR